MTSSDSPPPVSPPSAASPTPIESRPPTAASLPPPTVSTAVVTLERDPNGSTGVTWGGSFRPVEVPSDVAAGSRIEVEVTETPVSTTIRFKGVPEEAQSAATSGANDARWGEVRDALALDSEGLDALRAALSAPVDTARGNGSSARVDRDLVDAAIDLAGARGLILSDADLSSATELPQALQRSVQAASTVIEELRSVRVGLERGEISEGDVKALAAGLSKLRDGLEGLGIDVGGATEQQPPPPSSGPLGELLDELPSGGDEDALRRALSNQLKRISDHALRLEHRLREVQNEEPIETLASEVDRQVRTTADTPDIVTHETIRRVRDDLKPFIGEHGAPKSEAIEVLRKNLSEIAKRIEEHDADEAYRPESKRALELVRSQLVLTLESVEGEAAPANADKESADRAEGIREGLSRIRRMNPDVAVAVEEVLERATREGSESRVSGSERTLLRETLGARRPMSDESRAEIERLVDATNSYLKESESELRGVLLRQAQRISNEADRLLRALNDDPHTSIRRAVDELASRPDLTAEERELVRSIRVRDPGAANEPAADPSAEDREILSALKSAPSPELSRKLRALELRLEVVRSLEAAELGGREPVRTGVSGAVSSDVARGGSAVIDEIIGLLKRSGAPESGGGASSGRGPERKLPVALEGLVRRLATEMEAPVSGGADQRTLLERITNRLLDVERALSDSPVRETRTQYSRRDQEMRTRLESLLVDAGKAAFEPERRLGDRPEAQGEREMPAWERMLRQMRQEPGKPLPPDRALEELSSELEKLEPLVPEFGRIGRELGSVRRWAREQEGLPPLNEESPMSRLEEAPPRAELAARAAADALSGVAVRALASDPAPTERGENVLSRLLQLRLMSQLIEKHGISLESILDPEQLKSFMEAKGSSAGTNDRGSEAMAPEHRPNPADPGKDAESGVSKLAAGVRRGATHGGKTGTVSNIESIDGGGVSTETLETVKQFEQTIAGRQILERANPVAQLLGEPALILFPALLHGMFSQLEMRAFPPEPEEGEGGRKKRGGGLERVAMSIPLPNLGEIHVDIRRHGRNVELSIRSGNDSLVEFLASRTEQFERSLETAGFFVSRLSYERRGEREGAPEWVVSLTRSKTREL